jgi:hypothetical protein
MKRYYEKPQFRVLSIDNSEPFLASNSPVIPSGSLLDEGNETMDEETYVW